MKKHRSRFLTVLMAALMLLSACGQTPGDNSTNGSTETPATPFTLNVCVSQPQDSLDPAKSGVPGGEMVLFHLYENLMRWVDDGNGYAVLAPGQAESYTLETDYAGNATYTFTLRGDIRWSDEKAVTAQDFVTAWRRLADPANDLPKRELLSMVAGYDQVQNTGDTTLLSVSAPSDTTFMVTLNGNCAYFLEEVCAGAYTMPVREDLVSNKRWGTVAADTVTNGAYVPTHFDGELLTMERSDTYYDVSEAAPEILQFFTASDIEGDYEKFLNGEIDLIRNLPVSVLEEMITDETWQPEPVTSTYAVTFNTLAPPFDNSNIRLAFRLAIDPQGIADTLEDFTTQAAVGLVPYGITDHGQRIDPEIAEKEAVLPDPNVEIPEEVLQRWDFRSHSQELITLPAETDYAENCRQAQALMAQAGYAKGGGFPVVEYIYVESEANRVIARTLQSMWQEQLGVTVAVREMTQAEYDAMLIPSESEAPADESTDESLPAIAPFQMAGQTFSASHNDAGAFLNRWHSDHIDNIAGYNSPAYDILMDSATAATDPLARDAYLHDAEAILFTDAPVIPICYSGSSYLLADGFSGLYRAPNGIFFLSAVTNANTDIPSN